MKAVTQQIVSANLIAGEDTSKKITLLRLGTYELDSTEKEIQFACKCFLHAESESHHPALSPSTRCVATSWEGERAPLLIRGGEVFPFPCACV